MSGEEVGTDWAKKISNLASIFSSFLISLRTVLVCQNSIALQLSQGLIDSSSAKRID